MAITIVKKDISLNVGQPNNFELICAMQGDNKSFEITATLYDVNKLYAINTNNIKIKGINPVGLTIQKNVDSHTANTVTFTLTEDMLMYDGLLKLVLVFAESSVQLTTFPFIIKIINSPGNDTADDIKTVSALVEEAKKWAMMSKSYAVGTENEVRDGDKTDNSKFYYEQSKKSADNAKEYYNQIQSLINSGSIGGGGGTGNANILYYDTYEEFKADLDAGKIPNKTLICIKENKIYFTVQIVKADNMSWDSTSGNELQENISGAMVSVIYTANSGYYFPSSYNIASKNGIDITRNNDTTITVSGTPTDDTQITLTAPNKMKSAQNPPTGLSDGGSKINGTTSAMEYASSPTASTWTNCSDGSTTVTAGTWYVRFKETDSLNASDSVSIIIDELETDTPFEPGTLVALGKASSTYYSTDKGITWKQLKNKEFVFPVDSSGVSNKIKLCNGNYYCLDYNYGNRRFVIYQSKTLKKWNVLYDNSNFASYFLGTLFYDNKIMLIGGDNNNSFYSTDNGKTWNRTDIPVSEKTKKLTVNSNNYIVSEYKIINFCTNDNSSIYVASGSHGHCYYSYNGKNWNNISGIHENNHYVATYNNGKFYLIGFLMHYHDEVDDKKIRVYSSNDGISWTKIVEKSETKRYALRSDNFYVWFNNKLVFGTLPNITVFNPNNNSISYITPKSDNSILFKEEYLGRMVVYNNELYTRGGSSSIFKSSDITNWKLISSGNGFNTNGILVSV